MVPDRAPRRLGRRSQVLPRPSPPAHPWPPPHPPPQMYEAGGGNFETDPDVPDELRELARLAKQVGGDPDGALSAGAVPTSPFAGIARAPGAPPFRPGGPPRDDGVDVVPEPIFVVKTTDRRDGRRRVVIVRIATPLAPSPSPLTVRPGTPRRPTSTPHHPALLPPPSQSISQRVRIRARPQSGRVERTGRSPRGLGRLGSTGGGERRRRQP